MDNSAEKPHVHYSKANNLQTILSGRKSGKQKPSAALAHIIEKESFASPNSPKGECPHGHLMDMSCFENNIEEAAVSAGCGCANASDDIRPILCQEQYRRSYRECCDQNGRCCRYPCTARDPFWPEFARPRGLSCAEVYSGQDSRCMGNSCSCGCGCSRDCDCD